MRDWYTKTTLTATLGLLVWNMVARHPVVPTVHAESGQYSIEVITANAHRELPFKKWGSPPFSSELTIALNTASKGRELVTVFGLGSDTDNYVAVFKQRTPESH